MNVALRDISPRPIAPGPPPVDPLPLPGPNVPALRRLEAPIMWLADNYFRAEVSGIEHLRDGPALLVGNHNGGLITPDSFILAWHYMRRTDYRDPLRALGHTTLFRVPGLREICQLLGMLPASWRHAEHALARGCKVLVYPGGELESMRASRNRDRMSFHGRTGFARIALRQLTPVIPVVSAGAHDGWHVLTSGERIARALRLDRTLRLRTFPLGFAAPLGVLLGPGLHVPLPSKVLIRVLPPRRFEGDPDDPLVAAACAAALEAEMQAALAELSARLREPGRGRRGARVGHRAGEQPSPEETP